MRKILVNVSLLTIFILSASSSALATIELIKGTLSCATGCGKNVVQLVAPGEQNVFEVIGQFVDGSTAVQITGAGVSVSYGTRKGGHESSIVIKVNVDDNAAASERTVKMRYLVEADGYDSFVIKVVKKGSISQIQMKRPPLQIASSGIVQINPAVSLQTLSLPTSGNITAPLTRLVPAVNIPLNEKVVLVVSGTKLGSVELRPGGNYRDARILPGATDSRCEIEIEFTASGQEHLLLFDAAFSVRDMTLDLILSREPGR